MLFCGSCGSVFTLDDVMDMDDVTCPECGARDIGAVDDHGDEERDVLNHDVLSSGSEDFDGIEDSEI